jgi:hypothetical protein
VRNIFKSLMELPAIPLIRQKPLDKRLFILAAAIAVFFSMNAMAADIALPASMPPSAGPGTTTKERLMNQQETRQEMLDHWEKMSPKEREQVRNKLKDHWKDMTPQERDARRREMREHFKNMSPEERRQFQRDMGKMDDMILPVDDLRDDNTGGTASPVKLKSISHPH